MMERYFAIRIWGLYIGLATVLIIVLWAVAVMVKDGMKEHRGRRDGRKDHSRRF